LSKLNREPLRNSQAYRFAHVDDGFLPRGRLEQRVLRYANAGHPKPLHCKPRQFASFAPRERLRKRQPALGLFEDALYETFNGKARAGRSGAPFTDGLYEVHNAANELYTQALLIEGVQRRAQLGAGKLFDDLLEEIRAFSGETGFFR